MTVKTTTLTAVLALSLGFGGSALAQQTRTITVPMDGTAGTQPAVTPGWSYQATPSDDQPVTAGAVPAEDPQNTAGAAFPTTTQGAAGTADTGTTGTPVPIAPTGNGEPATLSQDNPAGKLGDSQVEAVGSTDPHAAALQNEPAPGRAGAETEQAAAPIAPPADRALDQSDTNVPVEVRPLTQPQDGAVTNVATPGSDAPATTAPAGTDAPADNAPAPAATALPTPAPAADGAVTPTPDSPPVPGAPMPDAPGRGSPPCRASSPTRIRP